MTRSHLRFVIALGVISAVGPFSIDMYLATFPSIAANLRVSDSAVQLTMMTFAVAVAVGQLIYGPAADMFGRRPPLFAGLALYLLASLGCAVAPNVQMLIVMRFLQGLGACGGMVIARAVVRDLFRGAEAVRILSGLLLVIIASPLLAPLAGSAIALALSWRWVFGALTLIGLAAAGVAAWMVPETLASEARQPRRMALLLHAYALLSRERRFLAMTAVLGCTSGVLYAYLSGASLLFIQVYGVPPPVFSLIFAGNAIGMITVAQFTSGLVRRFGAPAVVIVGCAAAAGFQLPLALMTHAGRPPILLLIAFMYLAFAGQGLVGAPATMIAMESQDQGVGAASALLGALQFALSALASAAVSLFAGPREAGMFVVMAVCSIGALAIAALELRPRGAGGPPPSRA